MIKYADKCSLGEVKLKTMLVSGFCNQRAAQKVAGLQDKKRNQTLQNSG